ncbi:MAG: hypothetical protein ACI9EW_000332 [Cellvibrionaceae bacterium]|jgi:hypothetical protein
MTLNHRHNISFLFVIFCSACAGLEPESKKPTTRDALAYQNRLQGMWLGSTIANWTGLRTEGVRNEPPFYTDDDWGEHRPVRWSDEILPIEFVFQDPWLADDDTDIEYVYLHLMDLHGSPLLTAEQISEGWEKHINHHIWVSNASARGLMRIGAKPPTTSMLSINENSLAIDAQLTTEIFGAMAPGMPGQALALADLPIRTTASGYSAHAAQFYVVLYSLASQVDPEQEPKEQILWMVEEARKYIPDSSKSADIVDFVLADYLDNPDVNDWERTRDRVYDRYHLNAEANGFVYRDWIESSVNFAAGLIALLYGEGDFQQTVKIGTLSGWDSDNGTSSMAGVIGLMIGYDKLVAQFPEQDIVDRYHILRTRDDLPDYLPEDKAAEDSFLAISERMIPLVEQSIVMAGGLVEDGSWTLPSQSDNKLEQNPYQVIYQNSQNNRVRLAGGTVIAKVNGELADTNQLVDGLEYDFSGREIFEIPQSYRIKPDDEPIEIEVLYDRPVEAGLVRVVEGGGGGFESIKVELWVDGGWESATLDEGLTAELNPKKGYEILDFVLAESKTISGFKIIGQVREKTKELRLVELDAFIVGVEEGGTTLAPMEEVVSRPLRPLPKVGQ